MSIVMPRVFRQRTPSVSTDDPRIAAVIMLQDLLSRMSEAEQEFVIDTVRRNLELHRQGGERKWQFQE